MQYQLGPAMLDAFILSIVSEGDSYGYQISQEIKNVVNLKESTLYPVLKRLQEAGYLSTYDQPCQGRNRRYYKLTLEGECKRLICVDEWEKFKVDVDKILLRRKSDE